MTTKTYEALDPEYKLIINGKHYLMLAGKFRPVELTEAK